MFVRFWVFLVLLVIGTALAGWGAAGAVAVAAVTGVVLLQDVLWRRQREGWFSSEHDDGGRPGGLGVLRKDGGLERLTAQRIA